MHRNFSQTKYKQTIAMLAEEGKISSFDVNETDYGR